MRAAASPALVPPDEGDGSTTTLRLARFSGSNSSGHSRIKSPPSGRKIWLIATPSAGHSSSVGARGPCQVDTGPKDNPNPDTPNPGPFNPETDAARLNQC